MNEGVAGNLLCHKLWENGKMAKMVVDDVIFIKIKKHFVAHNNFYAE